MKLLGRDDALRAVDARLSALPQRGGALLVRGARGLGRSAMLEVARRRAEALGFAVLAGTGDDGLERLLRPVKGGVAASVTLDADRRAVATSPAHTPLDRFAAGVAILEALAAAARRRPIVVLVDDAERLDPVSRDLLAFAARRLDTLAAVVIAAADTADDGAFPVVDLEPLEPDDARELVAAYALPRRVEAAVLATAEGMPLALIELAREAAACADALAAEAVVELPVGWRLAAALRNRLAGPPALLLAAALDPAATVDELLAASGAPVADLAVPLSTGTLVVDAGTLRFRSRLTALAVHASASPDAVAATHAALARAVSDPDRRALHHAAATMAATGPRATTRGDGAAAERSATTRSGGADWRPRTTTLGDDAAAERSATTRNGGADSRLRATTHGGGADSPGPTTPPGRAAPGAPPGAELADALGRAGRAARRRGEPAVAVVAYEAAARFSAGAARVKWLLDAAAAALELGAPATVRRLLDEAERHGPPATLAPLVEWQRRLLVDEWPPPDDEDAARLIEALVSGPDADAALSALMPLAMDCWWADPSPRMRALVRDGAARLQRRTDDPRRIAIAALAGPDEAAADVRRRLVAPAAAELADPLDAVPLAIAAQAVGAWRESYRLLAPAVERLRRRDHAGALAQAVIHCAHAAFYMGEWRQAAALGAEARGIAQAASRPRQAFAGALTHARALALTGGGEAALAEVAARAARTGLPGADAVVRSAQASVALAAGDFERVVERLDPLFAPGRPPAMVRAGWEILDLVEALVATQRPAAARLHAFEAHALRHPGGLTAAAIACAHALLDGADVGDRGEGVAARHENATGPGGATARDADLSAWPYLRARSLLVRGERLRRAKRGVEATDALRAARDELLMLGAQPLVERAERELRAAGGARAPGLGELTPHELRIARLAADGLSNPQIGAQLAVSPRTISSHLYRVFPKLGVTSRAQLKAALED